MTATGPWISIAEQPRAGCSYLIAASFGGAQTFDVAFYNGRRKDGSHWWTLGNAEIDQATIDYYAEIEIPKKWRAT